MPSYFCTIPQSLKTISLCNGSGTKSPIKTFPIISMLTEQVMNYAILAGLWTVWCSLHSLLITRTVISFIDRRLQFYKRYHRILYNIFSLASFVLLFYISGKLPTIPVYRFSNFTELLRIVFFSMGVVLFIAGAKNYDLVQFMGLRQMFSNRNHHVLSKSGDFNAFGISKITRHPWYLAAFFVIWSSSKVVSDTGLIINIIFSLYLIFGTILEERKLVFEFGDSYKQYQKNVSMLFPLKWITKRFR